MPTTYNISIQNLNKNKNLNQQNLQDHSNNPELSIPISEWWNGDTETIKFIDKQLEKSDIKKFN